MAGVGLPSSSAMALREAFGDRKLPDISRKITACVACRKLKIKCHMPTDGPPCDRCKQRDLSCTVNRSLQQVLESDFSWKDSVEDRLASLERTVASLIGTTDSQSAYTQHGRFSQLQSEVEGEDRQVTTEDSEQQQSWEVVDDGINAPAAIPASYISEIAREPTSKRVRSVDDATRDIVARSFLHINDATTLFELYQNRLDHFLYGILGDHKTVEDVRKASPLLAEAVFTVAALNITSANYAACRQSFMKTVSAHTFSKKSTSDDVRGLCIGAFWLSDLSWPLIGLAVRIANEINLNRAFSRPKYSSREWYLNARLYLLVHVCDRHCSIAWGRAPMSETFHDLTIFNDFLTSEHASQNDQRLVSQLQIWSINYRTYKVFGLDTESRLPDAHIADFQRISIALDTWRADWQEKFGYDQYVGNYPRQGVSLHYNFAKLYLFSHAYRGRQFIVDHSQFEAGLDEFAEGAVSAAESILRTINTDQEIQSHLNGLPTYFDAMIAFAVVFLLKVAVQPQEGLRSDTKNLMKLLQKTSETLQTVTDQMRPEHILTNIARSVKKLIQKASENMAQQNSTVTAQDAIYTSNDLPWLISPDDSIFVGNFDLTGPAQDIDFNFIDFSSIT